MTVRPAQVDDARAIASVSVSAWRKGYAGVMPDDALAKLDIETVTQRWTQTLQEGRCSVIVLEARRTPVLGFCSFGDAQEKDSAGTLGEILALNVHGDHWAQGYGTELLEGACRGLAAIAYEDAQLWVASAALRSRSFYEKCGWTDSEKSKIDSRHGFALEVTRYVRAFD